MEISEPWSRHTKIKRKISHKMNSKFYFQIIKAGRKLKKYKVFNIKLQFQPQ
jgi:hypothetical protein